MRRHFTLFELLIVIIVMFILVALLLPVLGTAKRAAYRVLCLNNQRQVGLAALNYASDSNAWLPQRATSADWRNVLPYAYTTDVFIKPMLGYGLTVDLLTCPARAYGGYGGYVSESPTHHITHAGQEESKGILYVAGLGDYGAWNESPPSAAPYSLSKGQPTQLLVVDLNMYAVGELWANINHTRYKVHWSDGSATSLSEVIGTIEGANRFYLDGHAEWVRPNRMGKNNTAALPDITSGRYSHSSSWERPYWW